MYNIERWTKEQTVRGIIRRYSEVVFGAQIFSHCGLCSYVGCVLQNLDSHVRLSHRQKSTSRFLTFFFFFHTLSPLRISRITVLAVWYNFVHTRQREMPVLSMITRRWNFCLWLHSQRKTNIVLTWHSFSKFSDIRVLPGMVFWSVVIFAQVLCRKTNNRTISLALHIH